MRDSEWLWLKRALALCKELPNIAGVSGIFGHPRFIKILSVGQMMSNARQARLTVEGCSQPNDERALGHPEHILFIQDTQFLPG